MEECDFRGQFITGHATSLLLSLLGKEWQSTAMLWKCSDDPLEKSRPRDWTLSSCTGWWIFFFFFYHWATGEAPGKVHVMDNWVLLTTSTDQSATWVSRLRNGWFNTSHHCRWPQPNRRPDQPLERFWARTSPLSSSQVSRPWKQWDNMRSFKMLTFEVICYAATDNWIREYFWNLGDYFIK